MNRNEKLAKAIEEAIFQHRTEYPDSLPEVERVIARHLATKVMASIGGDLGRGYRENYLDALAFYNGTGTGRGN